MALSGRDVKYVCKYCPHIGFVNKKANPCFGDSFGVLILLVYVMFLSFPQQIHEIVTVTPISGQRLA